MDCFTYILVVLVCNAEDVFVPSACVHNVLLMLEIELNCTIAIFASFALASLADYNGT